MIDKRFIIEWEWILKEIKTEIIFDIKFLKYKKALLMNQNTTWISTMPRTGSMWKTNVIREIYKYSKKTFCQRFNSKIKMIG